MTIRYIDRDGETKAVKDFIRKIDQKVLNGQLVALYIRLVSPALRAYRLSKITPLPRSVHKKFELSARLDFFKRAQLYLQVNRMDGIYAEFGSHEVNTFRMALRTLGVPFMPNKITKFYAFDSFAGMPEPEGIDKQKIWHKAMNHTSEERFLQIVRRDRHRVETVKGFYEDTLPDFKFKDDEVVALAYIDCDYYSSTKECLNFLSGKLQHGCLLAFDDWDCYYSDPMRGQKLAFSEFVLESKGLYQFEELCGISSGGKCFIVLEAGKVGKNVL